MKKERLHIGCSSYATPSWQPLFYPEGLPKKQWFDFYCQHFNTYEINSTFYRFPTVKSLLAWYNKTPIDFRFSIKAPKTITHTWRLENCKDEIDKFYSVSREGLKDKLSCVLFQLPPSFSYSDERLKLVTDAVDPEFRNAVEFRHESWWRDDVIKELKENNIIFCSVNYPKLPTAVQKTADTCYVRMHGNPKLFYSEYSPAEIEALLKDVITQNFTEAYIYFNNTATTAAIHNALQLKALVSKY